jgi:regulatory protein
MRKALMDKKSTPNLQTNQKKRKKISASYLENAGAYYLQRFSASVSQFRKVMERKIDLSCREHPDQEKDKLIPLLDDVVKKFENLGYLNDKLYTQMLVNSLNNKGISLTRMMMTLRQKGVPPELIEEMMPQRSRDDDKLAALRWAKKKRLGAFATRERENEKQKGLSSLARAGFDYDISNWVMSLSRDEAEDLMG